MLLQKKTEWHAFPRIESPLAWVDLGRPIGCSPSDFFLWSPLSYIPWYKTDDTLLSSNGPKWLSCLNRGHPSELSSFPAFVPGGPIHYFGPIPALLNLHLLLERPQSTLPNLLLRALRLHGSMSLFPSLPSFRGNCQPHISPAASVYHRELERHRVIQVVGTSRMLGNDVAIPCRQMITHEHPGQPRNVLEAPASHPDLVDKEITHLGS